MANLEGYVTAHPRTAIIEHPRDVARIVSRCVSGVSGVGGLWWDGGEEILGWVGGGSPPFFLNPKRACGRVHEWCPWRVVLVVCGGGGVLVFLVVDTAAQLSGS
jgi:hypothetical protein